MVVNGIIKPQEIEVEYGELRRKRFRLVYQEPGESPVALCGVPLPDSQNRRPVVQVCEYGQHVSSLQARRCASAMEWSRRLHLHGYTVLQQIRGILADMKAKQEVQA